MAKSLELIINEAFSSKALTNTHSRAILQTIKKLDSGELRVVKPSAQGWVVQEWLKKAILLYFRIKKMQVIRAGDLRFFDKIPLKKWTGKEGVRVVPHALVRFGAHISKGAILMPSYVNIGAYVGPGSLVDTWATVGSCAQVGANVHISGGVGLGGILEPIQARPVIIEDDVFLGSRSIIVEGVIVKRGAVIGAGVTLTSSTKIIDVSKANAREHKGVVPENSVVIPGSFTKTFTAGDYNVNCALIIGHRTESTDKKTSLNHVLRELQVPV
ncbi:MAG: 2,3,4,5-tetrahydropyridine-2,6-dicarboxylate N-succinyltransferase [Bdellovibrionales bacterium RBG_16_40_8]|nr:MAG: 2,3,4,5-tetrahydropyridine-2,6-dicarboxylate N-succinyltransferase [Bdellovibrionales bacterium RBG_16_40_8]